MNACEHFVAWYQNRYEVREVLAKNVYKYGTGLCAENAGAFWKGYVRRCTVAVGLWRETLSYHERVELDLWECADMSAQGGVL